ncbi:MAG: putative sugar phosphate isomerase/epimerase [Microbacteriaceae bacterium]|jgi:sugar phosphate isomerase/epimerase|nr:putative sugar phosphate isomerase/epimerase [Microbacteriaceae bacterium]
MSRFKYSYNAIVYTQEPIAQSFDRLSRFGYDAIELIGEPETQDVKEINRLKSDTGIDVSSICSIWFGEERDLVHPEASNRRKGVDYGKSIVDFAASVGAPTIIVGPSPVGKTAPLTSDEQEWAWAVENVREIGEYAASAGVAITLECWNRYETYFLNKLETAVRLVEDTGLSNAGVHGDMFHMNIEEVSIDGAFREAGKHLNHVHVADSSRAAPGAGHLDFRPTVKALKDIDYSGYVTFELLPASADPFAMIARNGHLEFLDKYTELAIKTLKAAEDEVNSGE